MDQPGEGAAKLPGFEHGGDRRSAQAATLPVVSQTAKAGLFNVSERLVRDAVAVQAPAIPAIVTAVELGRMTVTQAVRAAGLSEAGREQVVSQLGNGRSVATVVLGATRRERALTIERKATNVPLASLGRKYPVLYADPQWQWTGWSDGGLLKAGDMHYGTMQAPDICAMAEEIAQIAADDCALFMWFLPGMNKDAIQVVEAWGFTWITFAIALKNRSTAGPALVGVRLDQRQVPTARSRTRCATGSLRLIPVSAGVIAG